MLAEAVTMGPETCSKGALMSATAKICQHMKAAQHECQHMKGSYDKGQSAATIRMCRQKI